MKGLLISIYRTGAYGDCTNGGVSSKANKALVVGPGIPEIFDAGDRPVLRLEANRGTGTARLVPVGETGWTMMGGNFGYTSDSRFSEAVRAIYQANCPGADFYGAVPIHDRVE